MTAPVLEGRHLGHAYGADPVLADVSIAVRPGEVVAVMGPSGSGKSTLLHLLAGLLRPDSGQVQLAGERIDRLSERARAGLRLRQVRTAQSVQLVIPVLATSAPRRPHTADSVDIAQWEAGSSLGVRFEPAVSGLGGAKLPPTCGATT